MVRPFSTLGIAQRVTAISMITNASVLLLASVGLLLWEVSREREFTRAHLKTIAELIAVNTTASLSFDDSGDAEETLQALAVEGAVLSGCVYDADGLLFASYYRDPGLARCAASDPGAAEVPGAPTGFVFTVPVRREGEQLGIVHVLAGPVDIGLRLRGYAGIVGIVILVSGVAAFLLAVTLRRMISTPILQLTEAAHAVSATKDYSVQVRSETHDEIGTLVDAFNVMLDQIHERDRELESFAYSVSHDLRSPLRGMQGLAHLLLEDYDEVLDDNARGYLGRIQAGAIRMDQLIDGLLRLSRSVRAEMRTERVDLSEMAEQVAAEFGQGPAQGRSEIVVAPGMVAWADPHLLRVVMVNLLSNAWKFTAEEPRRRIEVGMSEADQGVVYFVKDNGVGFHMDHASNLFEPFHRLHPTEQFEGTGIGLATVARIVGRHGGRIWAEAETDEGATFYFTL